MLLIQHPCSKLFCSLAWLGMAFCIHNAGSQTNPIGLFDNHGDIGQVRHAGSAQYNSDTKEYTVSGSGSNMWFGEDEFHFVWTKLSGDFTLQADIRWIGDGGDPHRKACLLVRQDLTSKSKYIDAALHGDGLTSLQYREEAGGMTREIQANVRSPHTIAITRQGNVFFMSVAKEGEPLQPAGGSYTLQFTDPVFIGVGVCSHNPDAIETAVFSNVSIEQNQPRTGQSPILESTLEIISIASTDRRVVYRAYDHFEAPNWMPDGETLLFNQQGILYKIPIIGGTPERIDTGFATRCNNDHGISPDGGLLAISDQSQSGTSLIYILPVEGGQPRLVTEQGPSYWHGWSPDGKTLAYCAERNGNYDIYTISINGGAETRLTTADGLDDGPDYSSDGQYIYFNSERTGSMQIWRMKTDGSDQEQITFDEYNNWFPHPSPDGKWIVVLSYAPDVVGHPANKDVSLRLLPTQGGEIRTVAKLLGGQGTINVPSWAPDSRRFAFVSYRLEFR